VAVELKPANIMISVTWTNGQGQFASNNEITFNYMDSNVFHVLPHDNVFLGNASAQVSGQTITWRFDIPSETAFNWADVTEAEIIILNIPEQIYGDWRIPVTVQTAAVTPSSDGTISISLDSSTFEAGEAIRVTVTGITSEWVANGAFAAIYDLGAPYNSYSFYQVHNFTMPGSGSFELTAPANDGSFEVRLYRAGDVNIDHAFYDSVLFTTVSTTAAPPPPPVTTTPAPPSSSAPATPPSGSGDSSASPPASSAPSTAAWDVSGAMTRLSASNVSISINSSNHMVFSFSIPDLPAGGFIIGRGGQSAVPGDDDLVTEDRTIRNIADRIPILSDANRVKIYPNNGVFSVGGGAIIEFGMDFRGGISNALIYVFDANNVCLGHAIVQATVPG
jgi:hypothetical protein